MLKHLPLAKPVNRSVKTKCFFSPKDPIACCFVIIVGVIILTSFYKHFTLHFPLTQEHFFFLSLDLLRPLSPQPKQQMNGRPKRQRKLTYRAITSKVLNQSPLQKLLNTICFSKISRFAIPVNFNKTEHQHLSTDNRALSATVAAHLKTKEVAPFT